VKLLLSVLYCIIHVLYITMSGRREVFPESKKIGFSSPEFIQKKVYSVQYCISWLGYGPLPHSGLSQIFLEINSNLQEMRDVSFKKTLRF
jgi:hypothetical protein